METPVNQVHRQPGDRPGWWRWPSVVIAEQLIMVEVMTDRPSSLDASHQQGIVIPAGGKYSASALAVVDVLRSLKCDLPIEVWSFPGELLTWEQELFGDAGCTLRTAGQGRWMPNWWKGWQLKAYALLHSDFRRVVLLDADAFPLTESTIPTLFDSVDSHPCTLFPDIAESKAFLTPAASHCFGLTPFVDAPTDSGVMVWDRQSAGHILRLVSHINWRADWAYQLIWGDKDTFPVACKKLGILYNRLSPTSRGLPGIGIEHVDSRGRPIVLHRTNSKPSLPGERFANSGQSGIVHQADLPHARVITEALTRYTKAKKSEATN
jgi:hypothetical protein